MKLFHLKTDLELKRWNYFQQKIASEECKIAMTQR